MHSPDDQRRLDSWLRDERHRARQAGSELAQRVTQRLAGSSDSSAELLLLSAPVPAGTPDTNKTIKDGQTIRTSGNAPTLVLNAQQAAQQATPPSFHADTLNPIFYVGYATANITLALQLLFTILGWSVAWIVVLVLVLWLVTWLYWLEFLFRQGQALGSAWSGKMLSGFLWPTSRLRSLARGLSVRMYRGYSSTLFATLPVLGTAATTAMGGAAVLGVSVGLFRSSDTRLLSILSLGMWLFASVLWGWLMIGFEKALRATR